VKKKYFGTDGIRGRVGFSPISADWVLKLGWAAGKYFSKNGHGRVLIGKDTRISGYMFESALEAGLAAAGMDVCLLGPMPTPGVSYLTSTLGADAGIVISASHNPYYDNGIKFFGSDGSKLDDLSELAIEAEFDKKLTTVASSELGKASRINDAQNKYIEFCKSAFFATGQKDLTGLHIVIDCANGATYNIAPKVFSELGAKVTAIAVKPDGLNINLDCGSTYSHNLTKKVKEVQADLGISLDGDGDRLIMSDSNGNVIDGDEILFILAKWYKATGRLTGGVAGTIMSNFGLEVALKNLNIPFCRTKVGDRFIIEALKQHNWNLGGEASGHILCLDAHNTGDGIMSALKVLAVVCSTNRTLQDLKADMEKYPQVMLNVPAVAPDTVMRSIELQNAMQQANAELGTRGRIVLRPSGTEPLIRVMVEGKELASIDKIARYLANIVESVSITA
jgi:phosphoglucosamine mutase